MAETESIVKLYFTSPDYRQTLKIAGKELLGEHSSVEVESDADPMPE